MDALDQSSAASAGKEDAAFPTDSTPQYVNYLDIKLHRIESLPVDWYSDEQDGPACSAHPFRYEVSLVMPQPAVAAANPESEHAVTPASTSGPVAVFCHGRLLTPLSPYQQYVAAALPPAIATMDDDRPLQDVPETLQPPVAAAADAATGVPRGSAVSADTAERVTSPAAESTAAVPPVLLWVATEKTDAASRAAAGPTAGVGSGNVGAVGSAGGSDKRGKKKVTLAGSGSGASASGSVATPGTDAAALLLPGKGEPAPCVVRIPLDAAQQSYLETLLNEQQPLTLCFRRVLKPGAPADWEDFNANFFQATIPVSLAPFAEPGSLHLEATVPLRPPRPEDQLLQPQPSQQQQTDGTLPQQQQQQSDHERVKKKLAARRNKTGIPPKLYEDFDTLAPHPYTAAGTKAVVSLSLQRTLTRLAIDRVRPAVTPQQLIPQRSKVLLHGAGPSTTSASTPELVASAIEDIVRKILRDYKAMKQQKQSPPVTSGGGNRSGMPTADSTQAEKEAWRAQFLQFFQSSGQLAAYRAQLTPLVVRLVHERYAESRDATREQVSQLTNELYVYLLECTHATLRRLVDSDFAATGSTTTDPTDDSDATTASRASCGAWRSRALEAEASGDFAVAATYHQARINCACACEDGEGGSGVCQLPDVWAEAANFYVRIGDSVKAEQCYREALASDATHLPTLLGYGMLLMAYGRLSEAAVFLHGAVDLAPQHALAWGSIALLDDLYMFDLKEGSPRFELDKAKWVREHRYAVQQAAKLITEACKTESTATASTRGIQAVASSDATAAAEATQLSSTEEAVYLVCARYAVQLYHHDLANLCLARCQQGTFEVESLYARIFTQSGQYREALNTLDELGIAQQLEHCGEQSGESVKSTPLEVAQDMLMILRAACEEALGRTADAIKSYKAVLCRPGSDGFAAIAPYLRQDNDQASNESVSATNTEHLSFDPVVLASQPNVDVNGLPYVRLVCGRAYLHLGSLLLAASKYKDALGIFSLGLQAWRTSSVLWLGAGIAYHRMGNSVAAEECLCESNCLDPLNPRTWAYLTLVAIRGGGGASTPAQLEQSLQQAMVHGLSDAALWSELGRELLLAAGLPRLSEICLRRAISAEAGEKQSKASSNDNLLSASAYHLAHALAHMSRWDEARLMLEQVARTSKNEVLKAKAEGELRDLPSVI